MYFLTLAYYNYLAYIKGRIKAKDKETQEGQYQTLLKNLNKLLKELASITGKQMAADEIKNKVPTDSNLHE